MLGETRGILLLYEHAGIVMNANEKKVTKWKIMERDNVEWIAGHMGL